MSLTRLAAYFACDECGANFAVDLNPAYNPPDDWSLFDCAVDAVRGSVDYRDGKRGDFLGCSSVQDGKHLCAKCTNAADAAAPDEKETETPHEGGVSDG